MTKSLIVLGVLFVAAVAVGEEPSYLDAFLTVPHITTCYEWQIGAEELCPDGYGVVIVNTPTSDSDKPWCDKSLGVIIMCGRVVEEGEPTR